MPIIVLNDESIMKMGFLQIRAGMNEYFGDFFVRISYFLFCFLDEWFYSKPEREGLTVILWDLMEGL